MGRKVPPPQWQPETAPENVSGKLLNLDMDTPLEITTDGRSLIISPVGTAERQKKFSSVLATFNKAHEKTLKKLAE